MVARLLYCLAACCWAAEVALALNADKFGNAVVALLVMSLCVIVTSLHTGRNAAHAKVSPWK